MLRPSHGVNRRRGWYQIRASMEPTLFQRIAKGSVYGGAVIGLGVVLFKYTTPTDEELVAKLSPELRADYEQNRELRQREQQELMKIVRKTSASNDPIWKTDKIGLPFETNTRNMDPKLVDYRQFELERAQKHQQLQYEQSLQEMKEAEKLIKKKRWWFF